VVSETYARGSQEKASDGLIVKAISLLAAVLVIAGLGYAATTGARHKAALATADCEPNLSPSGLQCTTVPMLISQYAGVTTPVTRQLATDVTAYAANERHSLVAARAAPWPGLPPSRRDRPRSPGCAPSTAGFSPPVRLSRPSSG
jgi:hypothetical protein